MDDAARLARIGKLGDVHAVGGVTNFAPYGMALAAGLLPQRGFNLDGTGQFAGVGFHQPRQAHLQLRRHRRIWPSASSIVPAPVYLEAELSASRAKRFLDCLGAETFAVLGFRQLRQSHIGLCSL
jgi:hypothetical protein